MKQFLLAVLLLALTVTLTAVNAAVVRRDVDRLSALAAQDDTERLCAELEKRDGFLSLTVHHALLEQIRQQANAMNAYRPVDEEGMQADYRSAKETLFMLLNEIRVGEKCSIVNIF